ncbi:MAG TPA: hypothetical protein VMQ93_08415 [Novosphingobium sp.]|nr:hypothetical protein [Novosphingobium sp.]
MNRKLVRGWAAIVALGGLLNIIGVVPDWTTFVAVLALPFVMPGAPGRCLPHGRG